MPEVAASSSLRVVSRKKSWIGLWLLLLCYCLAAASGANAQPYFNIVDTFNGTNGGYLTAPVIQASNGNLYGTVYQSGGQSCDNGFDGQGGCGSIFTVTPTGTLTTLYEFCQLASCADGFWPTGALVQAPNGNLYGETQYGGAHNWGTVFEITPQGVLTTLYNFCSAGPPGCPDGSEPNGGLLLGSDGNLYGVTHYGGTFPQCPSVGSCGTLFQITPAGALTTLTTFSNPMLPIGPLVENSSGTFYGVAGYPANGALFSYNPGGGPPELIHSFCQQESCADGAGPNPPVLGADGNIYIGLQRGGTSVNQSTCLNSGGENVGCGGIYEYQASSNPIYNFCLTAGCPDGATPTGQLVVEANGDIYGTTAEGGSNTSCPLGSNGLGGCGTAFEISQVPSVSLTSLYNFCSQPNCADGYLPWGLMQETAGNFYGITQGAGSCSTTGSGCTLYSLSATSGNVAFMPAALSFGKVGFYETSAPKTITLTNDGTGTLYLNTFAPSVDFAVSSNGCGATLAPKAKCQIGVTFTPNQLGEVTGTISFGNSSVYSPQVVELSGQGITPVVLSPTTGSFGKHKVGTSSNAKTFTLKNDQSGLTLNGISISTIGPFAVSSTTCTSSLAVNTGCTIDVTFSPTATGVATGLLTVTDSSTNSPQISQLTGTGD